MHEHKLAFSDFFCSVVQGTFQLQARGTWTAFTLLRTAEARAHGKPWVGESITSLKQHTPSSDFLQEAEAEWRVKKKRIKTKQQQQQNPTNALRTQDASACLQCLLCLQLSSAYSSSPQTISCLWWAVIPCEIPWTFLTYHLPPANILDTTAKIFWPWQLSLFTCSIFPKIVM